MENCSICLEDMTKTTGKVILSCQHTFHYRCIDNWFSKQVYDRLAQNCPCCRDEGNHLDRASVMDDSDEESNYDSNEDDDVEVMEPTWVMPILTVPEVAIYDSSSAPESVSIDELNAIRRAFVTHCFTHGCGD